MVELVLIFGIVAILDMAALRWGVDSRFSAGDEQDRIR
jgi:hypothetical protein